MFAGRRPEPDHFALTSRSSDFTAWLLPATLTG